MSIVILGVDAPKKSEWGCIDNEQRTKYAICRPYDGITLNTEVEFLLDHNGVVMLFDSEGAAWEYLKPFGITEEETDAIKVVEYVENEPTVIKAEESE